MADGLIHLTIYRNTVNASGAASDILLLFNLGAYVNVKVENETTVLGAEDLLIVNPGNSFCVQGSDALCIRFDLEAEQFRECFAHRRYRFLCNSTREINDNYGLLRRILAQVLAAYYEQHAYLAAELNRLYYELLIFLVNHFAVEEAAAPGSRAEQMAEYIERNFREELNLQQVSEAFHMSPQYFSREFKTQMGQTYYKYLSGVRLRHARQDLEETDRTLLHIAMDNGFPNMDSFHRYFQQAYGQAPLDYRAMRRREKQQQEKDNRRALGEVMERLSPLVRPTGDERPLLQIEAAKQKPYHAYWRELLHLGDMALLDNGTIAEHLHIVQETMHFRFVRVRADCGQFDPAGEYSFYEEERRLDYLIGEGFMLWFYVDYREVQSWGRMCSYLDRLFSHFANRYSIGNIRKWRLELVYNTLYNEQKAKAYWEAYDLLGQVLQKYGCESPLLGAGLTLSAPEAVHNFCAYLEAHGLTLAEQTFEAEPYLYLETEEGPVITRATDSSYLRNKLLTFRRRLPYFRDVVKKVYITNWADSLQRTNIMNDSCYKGANLVKTLMDCFGLVEAAASAVPSDAIFAESLQGDILFGGNGLLNIWRT